MIATQWRSSSPSETSVYSGARGFPGDTSTVPFQARTQAVQEASQIMSSRGFRWPDANDAQLPFSGMYPLAHGPESAWLADALTALTGIDDEIAEENLPAVDTATKAEAERLIRALAQHPCAPSVYPTQDGEIAIHFKSPSRPDSVVILLNNGGQAECYAYTGGRSRRAHYDVSSDFSIGFLEDQLRALAPARAGVSAGGRRIDIDLRDMMFGVGSLNTL